MATFKVKFFGSKQERGQVVLVKMDVESPRIEDVETVLKYKHKYKIVQGLKINEPSDNKNTIKNNKVFDPNQI